VPKTDALGLVDVVVNNNGASSVAYAADLEAVAPAFWLATSKYVLAWHSDGSAVTQAAPARPGETIALTAMGLGVTSPPFAPGIVVPDGTYSSLVETPLVLFNGSSTLAQGAALVPGLAGVFNVNVQVPGDVQAGDVAVQLQVSGVQSDVGFYLPVAN
jgi:uncharacterized protein (TIGR03437 family)